MPAGPVGYREPVTSPPFDAQAYLAEPGRPAQVAAVSAAGVPLLGSLWFAFERGRFWFSSMAGSPLPQAAARGAPIAVLVDDFTPPHSIRQVRTRGRGQVEPHDAAVVQRIYGRYLGPDPGQWPGFFRARTADSERWVLWSAGPDSGLIVTSPQFLADELRWQKPADSPL
jgi:hypothetical protein